MEHERKRERAKEKSEVRLLAIFLLLFFFKHGQKIAFHYGGLYFLFWFRVFINEFHNYFVQNVYYITLRL